MKALPVAGIALALVLCLAPAARAEAGGYEDTPDARAVQAILERYDSPLPWWTIAAFKFNNPDFDVAGYLAVANAESSLGKAKTPPFNVGCIKWGGKRAPDDPKVWLRWMNGRWRSYGTYLNHYWGQRALIRLLWDKGYNNALLAHDWWGFANRYYGRGVAGISAYVNRLVRAHDRFAAQAAEYGADW